MDVRVEVDYQFTEEAWSKVKGGFAGKPSMASPPIGSIRSVELDSVSSLGEVHVSSASARNTVSK